MDADAAVLNVDETRKELQGFRAYFEREIEPWMTDQQDKQSKARRWAVIWGIAGVIVTAIVAYLLFAVVKWQIWALILTGVTAVIMGGVAVLPLRNLKGEIKEFLVSKICGFFGFEFSEAATGSSFSHFQESGLLPGFDRKKLEDEIRGSHSGVDFDLVECRLEDERRDKNNSRSYHEIYHGILFRFSFPKEFQGRTLVTKDSGRIGNFFKGIVKKGDRVKLEDPRFEKEFEVWGTDQIEARYLLTPTFMERVVELAQAMGEKRVEFCFIGNRLLVSVHVSKDHFEGGGIFTSVTDRRRVEQLVNEICKIFDIIDTLQLTLKTRI